MHKWILALVAALSVGAALATPATVVMLDAENMTCPACGITIRKALEKVPGVADVLLDPRRTWADPDAYDAQATKLVGMFADNFAQYVPFIDADVKAAAIG